MGMSKEPEKLRVVDEDGKVYDLTSREAAEIIGISRSGVIQAAKWKKLPSKKTLHPKLNLVVLLFNEEDVEKHAEKKLERDMKQLGKALDQLQAQCPEGR